MNYYSSICRRGLLTGECVVLIAWVGMARCTWCHRKPLENTAKMLSFRTPMHSSRLSQRRAQAEEWRENVAALAGETREWCSPSVVAFAGPLIEPAGEDSGGFHLRGASSTGKSTALRLAASVWGNPSQYCRLWRATTNGLEGLAALHNDGVLILDELGQVDPRDAGEAAYMLANGRGKARAARDGTARQSATWRLFFLSAGEESLSDV